MREKDYASASSRDGNSQIVGTTREQFLAYAASLPVFEDGGEALSSDPLTIRIASYVLHLPLPEPLGAPEVRAFDASLTALTFAGGTTVQCMHGVPPRMMGAIVTPPRDTQFKIRCPSTTLLCTVGNNPAAGRFVGRVDGFLSEEDMLILHVSSPTSQQRALVLDCLGRLQFVQAPER